ncbi:thiamine phosphate synthase [Acidicapsa acidisoli]|uniref:thiamine phosphate synthase n=1 Tax=Acidicapsa acidisoli TaxID=1615681 RepID=UPI0021E09DE6|nr:thiamine phosphate synthase [Acidicapsa acidisoli]
MGFVFPKIYPILDVSVFPAVGRGEFLDRLGRSLADAGVRLMEYRNKIGTDAEVLSDARILRVAMPLAKLVMDDRVDVALAAAFDGVHVDAGDLPPAEARKLLGAAALIGTSASTQAQLMKSLARGTDYIAFGPVFPTTTKQTSVPPIGVEGVARFRATAGAKPVLVAAAGITLDTAPAILRAGADVVAVSAAIFRSQDPAVEFSRWMATLG